MNSETAPHEYNERQVSHQMNHNTAWIKVIIDKLYSDGLLRYTIRTITPRVQRLSPAVIHISVMM